MNTIWVHSLSNLIAEPPPHPPPPHPPPPNWPQIAKFMGPTWGPPRSCRLQMGPMLAPWTLLSENSTAMCSLIGYDQVLHDSIDKVYDFFHSTIYMMNFHLAQWGVVTPYGNIDSRRLKRSLLAWGHQAITWTNVDLPSKVFSGIHLSSNLQGVFLSFISDLWSEFTFLKLLPHKLTVKQNHPRLRLYCVRDQFAILVTRF